MRGLLKSQSLIVTLLGFVSLVAAAPLASASTIPASQHYVISYAASSSNTNGDMLLDSVMYDAGSGGTLSTSVTPTTVNFDVTDPSGGYTPYNNATLVVNAKIVGSQAYTIPGYTNSYKAYSLDGSLSFTTSGGTANDLLKVTFTNAIATVMNGTTVTQLGWSNASNNASATFQAGSVLASDMGLGSSPVQVNGLDFNFSPTWSTALSGVGVEFDTSFASTLTPVPDPASLALLAIGLVALIGWRRKRA